MEDMMPEKCYPCTWTNLLPMYLDYPPRMSNNQLQRSANQISYDFTRAVRAPGDARRYARSGAVQYWTPTPAFLLLKPYGKVSQIDKGETYMKKVAILALLCSLIHSLSPDIRSQVNSNEANKPIALFPIVSHANGKLGYIDAQGNLSIYPQFEKR